MSHSTKRSAEDDDVTRRARSHLTLVRDESGGVEPVRFVCLVVEHARGARGGLAAVIAVEGLEVVTACSAAEALRVLGERRVDIVVADHYLPDGAGGNLLETIRRHWPGVGRVLVGCDLGADVVMQAVNRARVQRVIHRRMPAVSVRLEVDAALNEVLLERGGRVVHEPHPHSQRKPRTRLTGWRRTTRAAPSPEPASGRARRSR